jgi:hypothetical protein
MRIISRKFHAVLDYLSAVFLIAAPWLFGFENSPVPMYTAVGFGLLVFVLSILTYYEGGIFKYFSMWTHLAVDVTMGIVLASSPWTFGFSTVVFLPHLLIGLLAIVAGLTTKGGRIQQK